MHPLKNYAPGTIYHIIQRGNNHEFIFDTDAEKRHFLQILRAIVKEMPCHILYFVVMGNHYHLLIEMQDIPLSRIMQRINLRYSQYYGRQNRCAGVIFSERMTAITVKDTDYLRTLVSYLANNPVRAGITTDPESYPWSSHKIFLQNRNSFIAKDRLFTMISPDLDRSDAIKHYQHIIRTCSKGPPITQKQFIKQKRAADLRSILEKLAHIRQLNEADPDLILEFIPMALDSDYTMIEIRRAIRISRRSLERVLAQLPEIAHSHKISDNE